jgi:ATP-dependent Zn protease
MFFVYWALLFIDAVLFITAMACFYRAGFLLRKQHKILMTSSSSRAPKNLTDRIRHLNKMPLEVLSQSPDAVKLQVKGTIIFIFAFVLLWIVGFMYMFMKQTSASENASNGNMEAQNVRALNDRSIK